jgi:hypothetical protein
MASQAGRDSTPPDVDRNAGLRGERRHEGVLLASALVALAGWVLLRLELASTADRIRLAVLLLVVLATSTHRMGLAGLAWRRSGTETLRSRSAIRRHVDPGSELQERTDELAERGATGGGPWILLVVLIGQLAGGRWQHPVVAVPGALLLVAGSAGVLLWYRRWAAVCRQWLDDPPGRAPRPRFVLPADQRPWTISARQAAVLVVLVIGTLSALIAAYRTLG